MVGCSAVHDEINGCEQLLWTSDVLVKDGILHDGSVETAVKETVQVKTVTQRTHEFLARDRNRSAHA